MQLYRRHLVAWGWGVEDGTYAFQTCTTGCQAGIEGSGNGQFKYPEGIAIDNDGKLYVADSGNNRIQRFTTSGSWETTWSVSGSAPDISAREDVNVGSEAPRAQTVDPNAKRWKRWLCGLGPVTTWVVTISAVQTGFLLRLHNILQMTTL